MTTYTYHSAAALIHGIEGTTVSAQEKLVAETVIDRVWDGVSGLPFTLKQDGSDLDITVTGARVKGHVGIVPQTTPEKHGSIHSLLGLQDAILNAQNNYIGAALSTWDHEVFTSGLGLGAHVSSLDSRVTSVVHGDDFTAILTARPS